MTAPALLSLLGLLVAPVLALHRLAAVVDGWLLGGGALAISAVTYGMYALDKRRAETGAWRIPEAWLHLGEVGGGWPGAWVAQRRVRHKNRKTSYLIVFWLIVAVHQFAAIDYLRDWAMIRALTP